MADKGWPILDRLGRPVLFHAGQVQEHGEAGRAFDQRADRRAAEAENEVSFPMTRNSPVTDLRRAVADHQRVGNESLAAVPGTFAGQPEGAAGPQTG